MTVPSPPPGLRKCDLIITLSGEYVNILCEISVDTRDIVG